MRLEGRRTILFGRSPNLGEPGELPVRSKWALISRALSLCAPGAPDGGEAGGVDWELVDVRWDQGAIRLRSEEE